MLLFVPLAHSQVVINEYSCSNMSGITDQFGKTEDWVELHNLGSSAVNLTGYYLSDRVGNPTKWMIPGGSIPPNGYKIVFCSKRNGLLGTELHANFNLTQTDNEVIVLANTLGNIIDSHTIVNHTKENHSVGRQTDGSSNWALFTTPSPGTSNTGAQSFYHLPPQFSLPAGFYSGTQQVSISSSESGVTIRYTTNGSDVTATSTLYSGPITVSSTMVIRAAVFGSKPTSRMETNTYWINKTHTLPVVSVCSQAIYNLIANGNGYNDQHTGHFELFEADKSFVDEGQGHFNKHGNDSWAYNQRGFDFIMRDQMGYNSAVHHTIFPEKDRDEFQRLILKPAANDNYPFEDGAHIRDAYVHTLSNRAELKMDERTWRPCVLYLNGQYWGVYELREKVDDHDFTSEYYDQGEYDLQFLKTWGATWSEYGGATAQQDWNDLRNYVQNNDMGQPVPFNYVDSILNWQSMIDYFVLNSYIVSQDWLNWNTAWWRGLDPTGDKQKWRYTLWDMDASFGHYINYTGIPDPSANADPCNVENLPNPGGQGHTNILQKMVNENPMVRQWYITRYIDLLNTHFSCEYMNQLLDSMLNEIQPEMQEQIDKWGGTYNGWQNAVQDLKDFIDARCIALVNGMIGCYNLTGPFDITFNVYPANAGRIKVNSTLQNFYPWSTSYFGNIATLVDARPNNGYVFDHWEFNGLTMDSTATNRYNSFDAQSDGEVTAVFVRVDDPVVIPGVGKGFHLPNAFSPNGDGLNDFLHAKVGSDVKYFNLHVYDRWGNRVYQSDNPKMEWDGTFKGSFLPLGVYTYVVQIEYTDETEESRKGNITILSK